MISHNLDAVNKRLEKVYKQSPQIADKLVAEIAIRVMAELKDITPINTGNLVSNWVQQKVRQALREISNNTEYAPYIFYSTKSPHVGKIETLFDMIRPQLVNDIKKRYRDEFR